MEFPRDFNEQSFGGIVGINIDLLFLMLCCIGCLKDEKESLPVRIQMVFPEELQQVDKSGVNVKSVSYTHLDVYKRQGYCRVMYVIRRTSG